MNAQEKLNKWQLFKSLFKADYLPLLDSLPGLESTPFLLPPDENELIRYNRMIGWTDPCYLPPTWLQMRSLPTILNLLSSPDFPFSPLGLVHLENNIVIHDMLPVSARYQINCGITGYKSNHKGVIAHAYVEARLADNNPEKTLVYRVDASFLTILKAVNKLPKARNQKLYPVIRQIQESPWRLDTDIGRIYASISGDYNLIHIHPLCARLLGFRRHIAHGMYLQARALSEILAAGAAANIAFPMHINTAFKKPVYLPADITLGYSPMGSDMSNVDQVSPTANRSNSEQGLNFKLYSGASLHLTGMIK